MNIKDEMDKIKNEMLNNDFIEGYASVLEELSSENIENYFDYYLRLNNLNGLSSSPCLYAFLIILKKSDFILYKELSGLIELYNFFSTNKKNNICLRFSQIVLGFKVEENIIYLSFPLIFNKGLKFKNHNLESTCEFSNINIMVKDNVFYVGEKKVKNLKNYLMYEFLRSYKQLMNLILPEVNIIDYSLSDIELIRENIKSNNKLISLINY